MSILNKYKRWIPQIIIDRSNQLDVVLSQAVEPSHICDGSYLVDKCLISYINTNEDDCISDNELVSVNKYKYEDYINSNVELNDIGFTGIDNGLILFDKKTIRPEDFIKILTDTKTTLEDNDYRLHLHKVSGNTQSYSYDMSLEKDKYDRYYALNGGFFQGFYKLDNFDYQVLPNNIESCWNLEFVIRPKDYNEKLNTLNSIYPENAGTFFYIGSRSENKFAELYGESNVNKYPSRAYDKDAKCEFDYAWKKECHKENEKYFDGKGFLIRFLTSQIYAGNRYCGCEYHYNCDCCDNKKSEKEICTTIKDDVVETSNGTPLYDSGYFEINTDNSYLIYNRAKSGFTTKTWNRGDILQLTGTTHDKKIMISDELAGEINTDNKYLFFNETCHGYTVRKWENYIATTDQEYNVVKDLKNNAFSLKYNNDGSISYRYLTNYCEDNDLGGENPISGDCETYFNNGKESGWTVIQETSLPGLIEKDKWNVINVMFKVINGNDFTKCSNQIGNRKMQICIYINGKLKFISKTLPEFNFCRLNESFDKQEGVPYNISIGGGTQGLLETIWLDYYSQFQYILPTERYFAGTFIGDIKSFKFYNCRLEYSDIKENYLYEMGEINEEKTNKVKKELCEQIISYIDPESKTCKRLREEYATKSDLIALYAKVKAMVDENKEELSKRQDKLENMINKEIDERQKRNSKTRR